MARRRRGARLEMTSLMDVMFLVLVFFIYCIFDMSVHKGLKVDLPQAEGVLERGEQIVITISRENSFSLNGQSFARETILAKISALHRVQMNFPVILCVDRHAQVGAAIELLADLKKNGVEKVSFQVSGDTAEIFAK